MSKERFETILDYGSSKIRIGVFDDENSNNNIFIENIAN